MISKTYPLGSFERYPYVVHPFAHGGKISAQPP